MKTYTAFLRAINVGGTGKLPMSDLRQMCMESGFDNVRTYIASGNIVFNSDQSAAEVKDCLLARLNTYTGKKTSVFIRTTAQLQAIADSNPFSDREANRTVVFLLNAAPPPRFMEEIRGLSNEQIKAGNSEIYVYYPNGIGRSKLSIPTASKGTARNMNTIAKMLQLATDKP